MDISTKYKVHVPNDNPLDRRIYESQVIVDIDGNVGIIGADNLGMRVTNGNAYPIIHISDDKPTEGRWEPCGPMDVKQIAVYPNHDCLVEYEMKNGKFFAGEDVYPTKEDAQAECDRRNNSEN